MEPLAAPAYCGTEAVFPGAVEGFFEQPGDFPGERLALDAFVFEDACRFAEGVLLGEEG